LDIHSHLSSHIIDVARSRRFKLHDLAVKLVVEKIDAASFYTSSGSKGAVGGLGLPGVPRDSLQFLTNSQLPLGVLADNLIDLRSDIFNYGLSVFNILLVTRNP
jgi:hypothetical protein